MKLGVCYSIPLQDIHITLHLLFSVQATSISFLQTNSVSTRQAKLLYFAIKRSVNLRIYGGIRETRAKGRLLLTTRYDS